MRLFQRKATNRVWELIPVWDWNVMFDDASRSLFINPLYRFVRVAARMVLCG